MLAVSAMSVCMAVAHAAVIDPADYGFAVSAEPSVNAAALQKAFDGGNRTVKISVPGEYRLDRTVFIDDDTVFECVKGVVLKKHGRYPQMLLNRGAFDGITNKNVTIRGLQVKANATDMTQGANSPAAGLRGQIAFVRIRNLVIEDFVCRDFGMNKNGAWRPFARGKEVGGSQYCIQICGFDGVRIERFDIQGGKDGIHLNYGRGFVIRDGRLCTYDDGIALNAGDWPCCSPVMGSLEDGLIENIEDLPGGSCNFARVISGCWQDWRKGMKLQRGDMVRVGCRVYSVNPMPFDVREDGSVGEYVSVSPPTHTQGVWKSPEGINFLFKHDDGNLRADIRRVVFRNIKLDARRGINCGWEINKWARMVHPDIPEKDWPVIDIVVENLTATTDFPVVDGFANAKVLMRNVRSKGPLYQERFRDDKNSVIRKGMYYRTKVDLTVEDCEFSDEVRTGLDFRFTDAKGSVMLDVSRSELKRPMRMEVATLDFRIAARE